MGELQFGMLKRKTMKQVFLYGVFGVSRNLTGYFLYLLITYFGAPPKVAVTCLYSFGMAVGFYGNSNYIFAHKGSKLRAGSRYLVTHLVGYLLNIAILVIMVDKLGYAHQWVQILAIFTVAGFLFMAFKVFVFSEVELPGDGKD